MAGIGAKPPFVMARQTSLHHRSNQTRNRHGWRCLAEGNRDGPGTNLSWNCGAEGPTGENAIEDTAVEELQGRQVKNFIVILLTSIGTPMHSRWATKCGAHSGATARPIA